MYCAGCGSANADGSAVCSACGATLARPAEAQPIAAPRVFCPSCGAPNDPLMRYCRQCAAALPSGGAPALPSAGAGASTALARVMGSKQVVSAAVGAVAGLALVIVAAALLRTVFIQQVTGAITSAVSGDQGKVVGELYDKLVSVPALAVLAHMPMETAQAEISAAGQSVSLDMTMRTPLSLFSAVALLAMLLAGYVSAYRGKPETARKAVGQGAMAAVPYAFGVLVLAMIAGSKSNVDIPIGSQTVSASLTQSFSGVPVVLFCLVVGGILGAIAGLAYFAADHHRQVADLLAEVGLPFYAQLSGTVVALALALAVSMVAAGVGWTAARGQFPKNADLTSQQVLRSAENAFLGLSPTLAFYAYDFGHAVPIAMSVDIPQGSAKGQASLGGLTAEQSGRPIPDAPQLPGWVFLALLLPVVPLLAGGYVAAALSPRTASPVVEGAKVAVPYAAAMLGLAFLTSAEATYSIPTLGQANVTFGASVGTTAVLALVWGGVLGAAGGWLRGLRAPQAVLAPVVAPVGAQVAPTMAPAVSVAPAVPPVAAAGAGDVCVSCGASLHAGAGFCGRCGTRQT